MVQPRQFIEPGLGWVSTYFDFGVRLFSTQWPPYGAHILQGLVTVFSFIPKKKFKNQNCLNTLKN